MHLSTTAQLEMVRIFYNRHRNSRPLFRYGRETAFALMTVPYCTVTLVLEIVAKIAVSGLFAPLF